MQLDAVGKMCPAYKPNESFVDSINNDLDSVSCSTCVHWKKGLCEIDLFDEVLSSLDQT